jgi:glyoxylase-like metal-dependent hydrolase (beta-lactamase superfamily II)
LTLHILSEEVGPLKVLSYLVACPHSREALLIDPGGPAPRLARHLDEQGWHLRWLVLTHGHADHCAGTDFWKAHTGAAIVLHHLDAEFFRRPEMQEAARAEGFAPLTQVDWAVAEETSLPLGQAAATLLHTPGHTPGSICVYFPGHLFTGDTLFVGAAGRTDLPGGSLPELLRSLEEKIMPLPDETLIYPGHDYGDTPTSTLGMEKATNPYLTDFF